MTTGILLTAIDQWLYATLKADSTLTSAIGGTADPRIYYGAAPQGSAYPVVTFHDQAAPISKAVGSIRVMDRPLYLVKAIDGPVDSRQGTLRTIANRIVDVLHNAAGTAGGGTVIVCTLEEEFSMSELAQGQGGDRYEHLGGMFRIRAQN